MPTRDYNLGGDSSELVGALGDAAEALRGVLEAVERLEEKIKDTGKEAEEAVDKATKSTQRWKAAADGAVSATGALVAGVFAGVAAFKGAADSIAGASKELDYFQTRTGLSTDTLAGLRRAAEGTGQTLDDLVPEDLGTRIVEALEGTGEGARVFEILGVKVRDTGGAVRDTEAIFRDYVDALSRVENRTVAAGLADDLFSDQGTRLLHVLEGGTVALDEYSESARRFGNDTGPDAAAAAAKWTGATAALSLAFEDARAQLVGPLMSGAATFVNEFALGFVFLKDVALGVFSEIDDQIVRVGKLLTGQISVADFFAESLDALTDPWEEAHDRAYAFFKLTKMGAEETAAAVRESSVRIVIEDEREKKKREDAAKKLSAAEAAAAKETAKAEREAWKQIQGIRIEAFDQRIEQLEEEATEAEKLGKATISRMEKETEAFEKELEKRKKAQGDFIKAMGAAAKDILDLVADGFAASLDSIEGQKDYVNEQLAEIREMEKAGAGANLELKKELLKGQKAILREQEKDVRKAILDAFYLQQGAALGEIAINAAVAVMQALAQLGPVAGAFAAGGIGVTAGVQAAAVLAQKPPLHDGGAWSTGADEGMVLGRLMRAGEGLAVLNQRAMEGIDRANRDIGAGSPRELRLVLGDAGRAIGEVILRETERPGSPLSVAGSTGAIDPYRRAS